MREGEAATSAPVEPAPLHVYGPRRARILTILALALALLAHALLAWTGRPAGMATGQDDAEYIILSESLLHGGYNELHRVDAPVHAQYPPVYPAMLGAWSLVTGRSYDARIALNILLSTGALLLLFLTLRRVLDDGIALASVVVLAWNLELVRVAGSVMSEPAYMFFAALCLLLLASERQSTRHLAAAGAAAILAALTRSIGVTLLAAVALHWLLERRWRAVALLTAASAVTVGAWLLWTVLSPDQHLGMSYIAELRTVSEPTAGTAPFLSRIPGHAAWYARTAVPWDLGVPTFPGTPVDNLVWIVIIAVTCAVGWWTFVKRWRPAALYMLAYGGLLLVWVWRTERFIVPMLPLLVPAMLVGAAVIARRIRPALAAPAMTALAIVLAVSGGSRSALFARDRDRSDRSGEVPPAACLSQDQAHYFETLRFIRRALPTDAVILTAKSGALYLYTGRKTVSYGASLAQQPETVMRFLRDQHADYVLLSGLEEREPRLAELLEPSCARLDLVAAFPPRTYLLGLTQRQTTPAGDPACKAIAAYRAAGVGGAPAEGS